MGFAALYKNTAWGVLNHGDLSISGGWGGSDTSMEARIDQLADDHKIGMGTHTLSTWVRREGLYSRNHRDGIAYRADADLAQAVTVSSNQIMLTPLAGTTAANLRTGFDGNDGHLLINDEIITYGAASLSGNVLTLSSLGRGQNGSTAAAHAIGARVRRLWTHSYGHSYDAGLEMMVNTIAPRLADIVDLGFTDFSLDGNEAATVSHDAMGLSAFVERFLFRAV